MPYIEQNNRLLAETCPNDSGELNYSITMLLLDYIQRQGELRYHVINDVVGALEGAKLEFYRRVAAPYEDTKLKTNGDVYPPLDILTTKRDDL